MTSKINQLFVLEGILGGSTLILQCTRIRKRVMVTYGHDFPYGYTQ